MDSAGCEQRREYDQAPDTRRLAVDYQVGRTKSVQKMNERSWLAPHLDRVLRRRRAVLSSWRDQLPTLQGRTRNFENWLLVELVHDLLQQGFEVRTNGQFDERRVAPREVYGLSGRKARAMNLSADLTVRSRKGCFSAEIKTGLAAARILDDLRIVKHYNDARITNRAEFGWVSILPKDTERRAAALKSVEKILTRIRSEPVNFAVKRTDIEKWLICCVVWPQAGSATR